MKRLLVVASVLCLSSLGLAAGGSTNGGGSDGCGLGWEVTQKKSFLATTTRATTNAVIPPSFGMSSGTIGCETHSFAKNDQNAIQFVAGNYEPLIVDMAQGNGEYLQAFHQTMGCSSESYGTFSSTLQKNFSGLSKNSSNVVKFYNGVKQELKNNSVLAASCNVI